MGQTVHNFITTEGKTVMTHPQPAHPEPSARRLLPALRTAALVASWITTSIAAATWITTSIAGRTHAADDIRFVVAISTLSAVIISAWWSIRRGQDRTRDRLADNANRITELGELLARSEVRTAEQLDRARTELAERLDLLESQRPDFEDGVEIGRAMEARAQNEQRGSLPVTPPPPALRAVQGTGQTPAPWRRN